jgi:hypothetical protein
MAPAQNFPYQGRIPSDMNADLKERGRSTVGIEQIEKSRSDGGVGPIIKRQGYSGGVTRVTDSSTEKLR